MDIIETKNLIVDFGRHEGERYTRLPVSYLNWMVNSDHSKKEIAQAELKRRGTTMPELDLSGHAIDRFSQFLLSIWNEDKKADEGLHSWMLKNAAEALKTGLKITDEKYLYKDINWIFDLGSCYPVLKTVIPK